jgi:hypothetical protein
VSVDDGCGEVDELAVGDARSVSQHRERFVVLDSVALHEDALGTLDQCAPAERAPKLVILRESPQDDVDRALPVVDVFVADVGEDAAFGCLADEAGVASVEQDDDRTGGFANDPVDEIECVGPVGAKPDKRDVGAFSRGDHADVFDLDLAGDDLVAQLHDDLRDEGETILALVGDEHSQMVVVAQTRRLH